MNFVDWKGANAPLFSEDPVWRIAAYQRASFAMERAWQDAEALARQRLTRDVSSQLYSAVGSIGSNIAEGYSRSGRRDRARFYEYALGSTREARHWYRSGSRVLSPSSVEESVETLNTIIYLLLRMIPRERTSLTVSSRT